MPTNLSYFKAYTLIFLCLLYPYLQLGSLVIPTVFAAIFIPAACYIVRAKFNTEDFLGYCLFSVTFLIIFFSSTLNDKEFSLRVLFLAFTFLFILFSSKQILYFCIKNKIHAERLYLIMINIILINSVFIILLNIGLINAESFYSIIYTHPRVFTYPIVRYPGFTYDAFSFLSVLNAFTLCLLLDQYVNKNIKSSLYFYFASAVIFVALVFTGRTGILVFLLYFLLKLTKLNTRILAIFLVSIMALLILSFISWGQFDWIKEWAFSFIFNFISGSSTVDSSVTGVQQHFFMPNNILLGDHSTFIEVPSDLGFIRFINSLGLLGLFIFFSYFIFLLSIAIKSKDQLSIFLVIMLSLLNFKDVYFVSPYGVTFFVLLVIFGKYLSRVGKSHEIC